MLYLFRNTKTKDTFENAVIGEGVYFGYSDKETITNLGIDTFNIKKNSVPVIYKNTYISTRNCEIGIAIKLGDKWMPVYIQMPRTQSELDTYVNIVGEEFASLSITDYNFHIMLDRFCGITDVSVIPDISLTQG